MHSLFKRLCTAALSLGLIAGFAVEAFAEDSPIELYNEWDDELKRYTQEICTDYNVEYPLVLAVIYNESRFQSGLTHQNTNGTTDYGLMQVNEVNYEWLHENLDIDSMSDLLDDRVGIECGVALLAYHTEYTEDPALGLLRYQTGEGEYRRMVAREKYSNDTYEQVAQYWNEYKEHFYKWKRYLIQNLARLKWERHTNYINVNAILKEK